MAEGPAGEQREVGVDTAQDLLIQQSTSKVSRGISSPGSSGEAASLSLAASAAPGRKKTSYYSENGGYLMELFSQQRLRIQQEIKNRFKPGETSLAEWFMCVLRKSRTSCSLPPLRRERVWWTLAESLVLALWHAPWINNIHARANRATQSWDLIGQHDRVAVVMLHSYGKLVRWLCQSCDLIGTWKFLSTR